MRPANWVSIVVMLVMAVILDQQDKTIKFLEAFNQQNSTTLDKRDYYIKQYLDPSIRIPFIQWYQENISDTSNYGIKIIQSRKDLCHACNNLRDRRICRGSRRKNKEKVQKNRNKKHHLRNHPSKITKTSNN